MEFALESVQPAAPRRSASALSAKMRFTALCVSSKFPRTAQTATLPPACVVICSSCTWLTLPAG